MSYRFIVFVVLAFFAWQAKADVSQYSGPVFIKVVGGLGVPTEQHTHPSTRCTLTKSQLALLVHDIDREGYKTYNSKTAMVNLTAEQKRIADRDNLKYIDVNLEQVFEKIEAAESEQMRTLANFAESVEKTVYYIVARPTEVEIQAHGQTYTRIRPIVTPIYSLNTKEEQRRGENSQFLIDLIDRLCVNDKPLAQLRPE